MGAEDIPIEVLREGVRLWEQGKHYESISENQKAIECYQEMMGISEPDPVVLNAIGFCYLLMNETDNCKDALKHALQLDPVNQEALHNLTMVMFDTDDFDEAEKLARRGIKVERSFAGNWHNLGKALYITDRLDDARETLATAIGLSPDRAATHYFMALTLDCLNEEDKTHRSFLRAIELEDDNVMYLIGYGRFLMNLKQPVDAEKHLRRAVEVEDLNHKALAILAECLIDQIIALKENAPDNLVGDAMELLNRSLDLDLSYGMSWYQWGRVWMLINDWEKAEEPLRNAIENDCEDPMTWAYLRDSDFGITYPVDLSRLPVFFRESNYMDRNEDDSYTLVSGSDIITMAHFEQLEMVLALFRDTLRFDSASLALLNRLYDLTTYRQGRIRGEQDALWRERYDLSKRPEVKQDLSRLRIHPNVIRDYGLMRDE